MKESDPPLPDVLESCTVYLTRDYDAWSVTVDSKEIAARCILSSPDYAVANREAWAAAIRWRAYLLIEDGTGSTSCLSPDEVMAMATQRQESSETGRSTPEG